MRALIRASGGMLAVGVLTLATACTPTPSADPDARFALTSAHVVVPAGGAYPVNLVFVAPGADPIWTDVTGIDLPGDADLAPGQFDVIAVEGADGMKVGNIAFELDVPPEGISFTTVGVIYDGRREPVTSDVGTWNLSAVEADEFSEEANAAVVAMSACTSIDVPLPPDTASVDAFDTDSTEVAVETFARTPTEDALTVSFSCSDAFDFVIISSTLDITRDDGSTHSIRLAPISIGFQDIDDADFHRIRDR
ncbi:hypothetical protein [Microbacterium sp. NPDC089695]|uniref:hypothetical protein n=1 Tax=Microbacterium sp. NPDC089695 TaxID=3364198 RepID=UPI00382A030D